MLISVPEAPILDREKWWWRSKNQYDKPIRVNYERESSNKAISKYWSGFLPMSYYELFMRKDEEK